MGLGGPRMPSHATVGCARRLTLEPMMSKLCGRASCDVPHIGMNGSRPDSHQHLVRAGIRPRDLADTATVSAPKVLWTIALMVWAVLERPRPIRGVPPVVPLSRMA